MTPQNTTPLYHSRLQAEMAEARAMVVAGAAHAVETGAKMPVSDPDDPEMKLYHLGGHWAMLFCLWFSFVSPIILVLMYWD